MRILFAAPDRDLLQCYKKLLEYEYSEVVTAFDGTQVIYLLSAESFDIVILDSNIPRINFKTILSGVQNRHIPVIVLTDEPISAKQLSQEPLPNMILSYPFTSEHIKSAICNITDKVLSEEQFKIKDVEIDVSKFRIVSGPRLTSDEIDVLKSLSSGEAVPVDSRVYIGALNDKFSQIGSAARIEYKIKKGFVLVSKNE